MMSKGLLFHLGNVKDLYHDIPSIDSMPVVNEFLDVFSEDFPGVPPLRKIDLEPDTNQSQFILIDCYSRTQSVEAKVERSH